MHRPTVALESSSRSALMTGVLALALLLLTLGSGTISLGFDEVDCPHPSSVHLSRHSTKEAQGIQPIMADDRSLLRVHCDGDGGEMRGASALLFGHRLNINRASLRELRAVPGLSDLIAQEIIRQRKRCKYNNINELSRIPGIGVKTVLRLKRYLLCRP